jgi:hypothetical protein
MAEPEDDVSKPFTIEQREQACAQILAGIASGKSLRSLCEADDWMPAASTFLLWAGEDAALAERYARAREARADVLAEEVLEIADDDQNKIAENANHARIKIDARKWAAAKMNPRRYGDKVAVGGAPDLGPIKTEGDGLSLLMAHLDAISSRTTGSAAD